MTWIQDTAKKSNKIVFGDDGEVQTNVQPITKAQQSSTNQTNSKESKTSAKKPSLFDDNDDEDAGENYDKNFEIKQQFEGKKGEKLRRLQDRFQGDNRFRMDSKFLEDDSGDSGDEKSSKHRDQQKDEKSADDIETNESDERQWQLNILESVMGKKVHTIANKQAHK